MANTKFETFIKKYGAAAQAAAIGSKIFPQTILTVAALESGFGLSKLTLQANNFGGIKAGKSWKGKTVTMKTREEKNGASYYIDDKFRAYDTPEDYFKDYVKLITNSHYTAAGVSNAKTPEEQFKKLQAAGYATAHNYAEILTVLYKDIKNWIVQNPLTFSIGFFLPFLYLYIQ